MFRYHPNYHFIQLHKKLSDQIERGANIYCLKTEDGVSIRKLFIKIVDTTMKVDNISYLLSVFGKITDMKVNIGAGRMRLKNRGYVTFERNCDATKALLGRKNFKEYFTLAAADSWLQPDHQENFSSNFDFSVENFESQLLAMLHDDCLLHVMLFLDPLDIFALENVCSKFRELSKFHFRTVKELNFGLVKGKHRITLLEAKAICEKVGATVTRLSVNSDKFNSQRILNFIPKYFKNLKHLQLIGFKLESIDFWQQMRRLLLQLETLDLSDNSFINENFLRCFVGNKARSLKSITLSNSNVSGDFLEMVPFIEHLNISGCRNISGRHLLPFVATNKSLQTLNIGRCPNIYGKAVNDILQQCAQQLRCVTLNNYYVDEDTSRFVIPNINAMTQLRELTIQNLNYPLCDQLLRTINLQNDIEVLNISYGNLTLTTVYAISTMKRLRKLLMNFKSSVCDDLVDYLVDKEHLEEIHIAACSYLSAENILRLFAIKSLRFLDISRCYGFSNEFVIDACQRVRETQPREKFILRVGQTEIDQSVLDDPTYVECKKYLHLSWDCARNLEHDYDIDEENNRVTEGGQNDCYNLDDIINVLSNIDECDPKIVAGIRRHL